MSTFDGFVEEFPFIQIDYFRKSLDRPPPLACFLSHVHSDHLQGLESFRAPFIYCSAATRELLLRLEKYPHRMNFSKGILESRRLHYKHLAKLLRPIPLDTPTEIELTPRLRIRVTLFNANHCTGAVMFLLEGQGKAILYSGDIRAETWWVQSLARSPVLLPYSKGSKQLDRIYLDTTFARSSNVYREFPPKAEGMAELLQKVGEYPDDTIFYFRAWTFGYEDVWMALSAALDTKIHLDPYQLGLYRSLAAKKGIAGQAQEASFLCGFELGNTFIPGCLSDDQNCRVHSCEPGVSCSTIASRKTVYITPIVNRMKDGLEVPEAGAGGGDGDLFQVHELELPDPEALEELKKLCFKHIHDDNLLSQTNEALSRAFRSQKKALSLERYGVKNDGEISLESLVQILGRGHSIATSEEDLPKISRVIHDRSGRPLPKEIHFPYSRHSSYAELCELVSIFKPQDVYPCTVDPLTWNEDVSMRHLFGHLCSGDKFTHDTYMREVLANEALTSRARPHNEQEDHSQTTQRSSSSFLDGIYETQHGASLPRKRSFDAHSAPDSSPIHIPESIHAHACNSSWPSQPCSIADPSMEAQRAKRNYVRQAWRFLRNHEEETAFHIGPLPSTWPSAEQDGFIPAETDHCLSNEDAAPETSPMQPEEDSQLSTAAVSISESAFSSSQQHSIDFDDDLDNIPSSIPREPTSEQTLPASLRRTISAQNRRAAYLAAKADNYDAWNSVSIISAGDNHTEPEIEL
ncbi:hypothetical protein ASPZODRAFT_94616 [Penicilliopsis zonata CBS 506.65]|uniref:Protein artemis n=1 Tax=Penicilliopsis zonata CBS 506.65 TaxID=1073090 RepID=A0A1L9SKY9_9EURO|nr:hypothetical protein ASPZODRAFT_94616 [Penicilliopsis zonata CBS 506.65]OJJ47783.1 hypothetical protein ASPZODRAFT_94616 [Penicilliopsis zonata CBS 506.65]